jgi:type I restriction enzyme M protein
MKSNSGRMAVVLPHGALFRKGAEGRIRENLIKQDLLEAVIGLGGNIFYGTSLAACVLVFRVQKHKSRKGKILFIDGSEQIRIGRAQNYLEKENIDQLFKWYSEFQDVPNSVKAVSVNDIKEKEFNLNIPLYIEKEVKDNLPTMSQAIKSLEEAANEAWKSEEKFKSLLKEFGLL